MDSEKNKSTVDCVVVLQSITNKVINHEKKMLYCAFIDLKKAFDLVYMNYIWFKLLNDDTGGNNASLASSKMVRMLRSMYNSEINV